MELPDTGVPFTLTAEKIREEAQTRWFKTTEVYEMLARHETLGLRISKRQEIPRNGTIFIIDNDKKRLRDFRKDGHVWAKKKDGKTIQESHEKLKVGHVEVLDCSYARGEADNNFRRHIYKTIKKGDGVFVLFHYRKLQDKESKKNGSQESKKTNRRGKKTSTRGKKTTKTLQSFQEVREVIPTSAVLGSSSVIVDHISNQFPLAQKTSDTGNQNSIQANAPPSGSSFGIVNHENYQLPLPPKTTYSRNQSNIQANAESPDLQQDFMQITDAEVSGPYYFESFTGDGMLHYDHKYENLSFLQETQNDLFTSPNELPELEKYMESFSEEDLMQTTDAKFSISYNIKSFTGDDMLHYDHEFVDELDQYGSPVPSLRPMSSPHWAPVPTPHPTVRSSPPVAWYPLTTLRSPTPIHWYPLTVVTPSPVQGSISWIPSPPANVSRLKELLVTQELLCSVKESVDRLLVDYQQLVTQFEFTIAEQQHILGSHIWAPSLDKDSNPIMSGMTLASSLNESPAQPNSETQRILRGQMVTEDQYQINPCTDLLRQKKARELSQPMIETDDVVKEATFSSWYDSANDDESQPAFLMGPRKKKDWWDVLVKTGQWLLDEHIDSYLGLLRHKMPDANWTSVDTIFVGWLPSCAREREEVGLEYKWPRLLLDRIEGVNKDNQGFIPWSTIDRVYIPINFNNQHWVCGELDLNMWTLTVYDSLKSFIKTEQHFYELISPYQYLPAIIAQSRYWGDLGLIPNTDPLTIRRRTDVPQQTSHSGDCGVFTLLFIEYLGKGLRFDFSAGDSTALRTRIAEQIFSFHA